MKLFIKYNTSQHLMVINMGIRFYSKCVQMEIEIYILCWICSFIRAVRNIFNGSKILNIFSKLHTTKYVYLYHFEHECDSHLNNCLVLTRIIFTKLFYVFYLLMKILPFHIKS